jgi:hypothetical protein
MTIRARSRSDVWVELFTSLVTTFAHAFVGALPVMFLTAFLVEQGWTAITPLGYWASYLTALLLGWIIDGAGTVRRAMDKN